MLFSKTNFSGPSDVSYTKRLCSWVEKIKGSPIRQCERKFSWRRYFDINKKRHCSCVCSRIFFYFGFVQNIIPAYEYNFYHGKMMLITQSNALRSENFNSLNLIFNNLQTCKRRKTCWSDRKTSWPGSFFAGKD